MKKALIIATVSGFLWQFEMNNVKILQNLGYEVHFGSNFHNPHYGSDNHRLDRTGIICHQIDFVRSPFKLKENLSAYKQLYKLIKNIHFQLIHCHTPMGGVISRLAVKRYTRKVANNRNKTIGQMKVLYTAHGFHFFKGAPIINWIFYYPIERWLARYTDVIITINKEDHQLAQKFFLKKGGKIEKINGVGISLEEYHINRKDKETLRKQLAFDIDDFIFISVGELSKRKNHRIVIEAIRKLSKEQDISYIRYIICGDGPEHNKLQHLIYRYNLQDNVLLVGYQEDIQTLLELSDCFILPSLQEGLPVALMEAMAVGLPIISSNIRGCIDLLDGESFIVKTNDVMQYANAMKKIILIKPAKRKYKQLEKYGKKNITKQMYRIYEEI